MTCRLSHSLYHIASKIPADEAGVANAIRYKADNLDRAVNALGVEAARNSYAYKLACDLWRLREHKPNFEFDETWVQQYAVPNTRPVKEQPPAEAPKDFFKTLARRIGRGH